jgi:GTPase SAR1 family protein
MKLQVWDSAGQEKYRSLIPNYIRQSAIIFIIFDITSKKKYFSPNLLGKETFNNVQNWIQFIKNIENPSIVLCGNKIDLEAER